MPHSQLLRIFPFPYVQKATMTTEVCTRDITWVKASKLLINKTASMKYEVPNIITHHHKIVLTSSLEMKVKHIKITWISKISWLYKNSLLYKAGNSKQKCSLIHLFPSKPSVQSSMRTNMQAWQVSLQWSRHFHPLSTFLQSCLWDLATQLLFVKKCFLHNTCLEHEVLPYKGSD